MTISKRKPLAVLGLGLGLLASTGTGIFLASAEEKTAPKTVARTADAPKGAPGVTATSSRTAATTLALDSDADLHGPIADSTVAELLEVLSLKTGATIRLDVAFFRASGIVAPYDQKIQIPIVKGLSVRDILEDVLAQVALPGEGFTQKTGIRVKGNQIILGRGSVALATPGRTASGAESTPLVEESVLADVLYGPVVGIAAERLPLGEFVNRLREQTGANIVVDSRIQEQLAQPVTLTLNDTRLMTVLKIAGDAHDLAPAVVDNVYYLTTRDNADRLLGETYREIFGEARGPVPPAPAGAGGIAGTRN